MPRQRRISGTKPDSYPFSTDTDVAFGYGKHVVAFRLHLRRICFGKRDAVPGNFGTAPKED